MYRNLNIMQKSLQVTRKQAVYGNAMIEKTYK